MDGSISVRAQSVDDWQAAKPHVLAALLYITGKTSIQVTDDATGLKASLPFGQAQRAFCLLLEHLRVQDFPVKVKLGVVLVGKKNARC